MIETVEQAREKRLEAAIDRAISSHIDERLKTIKLAAPISPRARVKLRDILKHYAKEPHPFRACVKDNMKRFGPGRTEALCATLKDTIRGRKDWRGKNNPKDKGVVPGLSEAPLIDGEVLVALNAISDTDLETIFMEARAIDEFGSRESVSLLSVNPREELERWGVDGEVGVQLAALIHNGGSNS